MRFVLALKALLLLLAFETALAKTPIGNPQARRAKEALHQIAKSSQEEADKAREALRFVRREPYVPQLYDYGIELGAAWGKMNYYTVGAAVGFHVGTCVFSNSQTCQQYTDLILNVVGRDSHTHYLGLASLRWQFIHFPTSWSPFTRLLAGANNQIIPGEVKQRFVYGAGIGITTYLHPKADIRAEYRYYRAERDYSQMLFSVQFKMEKWIEFFAEKLKDIGVGTAGVVGTVVEGTGGVVGTVVEGTGEVVGTVVKETGEVTGLKKKSNSDPSKPEKSKEKKPISP